MACLSKQAGLYPHATERGRVRKNKEKMHYLEESCAGEQRKEAGTGCSTRELTNTGWACSAQANIIPTNLYVTTLVEIPLNLKHPGNKIISSRSGGASLLKAGQFYFPLTCHPC